MLTINVGTDCARLEVTADPDLIQAIDDPTSDQCCFMLTLGTNCCEPTIELPIRAIYPFQVEVTDCGEELLNDVLTPYVDITLTGIDTECVDQVTLTRQNGAGLLTFTDPETLTFRSYVTGPSLVRNYIMTITTSCDLDYILDFTITFNTGICDYVLVLNGTTYPDLPEGIEIVDDPSNIMYIYPEAFGQTGDTLGAGIYFVGLQVNNEVPQTGTVFVDCDVLCKVIEYISKYPTCNLYMLFEALQMSDDCTTITYQQKCTIWNYIGKRLGYFNGPTACSKPSNCYKCGKK